MNRQFRKVVSVLISVLAAGLPLASTVHPAQAAAPTFVVDDNKVQCPKAAYTDIQSAVDDMPSTGGTIQVCAGTYPNTLNISGKTNLKLIGKKGAVITIPGAGFDGVLVDVYNSTNVTIQGFTIDGQSQVGTQNADVAVEYDQSTGTLQSNTIKNWSTPSSATPDNGMYSVLLIGGTGSTVKVLSNVINGFQDHAIEASGKVALTISKNTISGKTAAANDPYGIYLWADNTGTPTGTVSANKLSGDAFPTGGQGAAIYLSEASPLTISGNTVTDWEIGLQMLSFCGSGLSVTHNVVKSNTFKEVNTGIILQSTPFYSCDSHLDNITVTGNKVVDVSQKGSDGIVLVASWNGVLNAYAQSELIKGNTVKHFNTAYEFSVSGPQVFVSGVFAPNITQP